MEKGSHLYNIRHSLSHVLAMAVLDTYPNAKIAIGPAIDTGFYYDIDFGDDTLSESDLKNLQKKMKKIIGRKLPFSHTPTTTEQALEHYKNNPYKTELINEFAAEGKDITLYHTGDDFTDLCAGGHVEHTGEIPVDAFKLDKIAGAYWRGDENNIMLTRIYGLAFETKEELDTHLKMIEEAKKRDHRKIAKAQGLLVFSDLVGSGMPMWTPKGNILRNAIIGYSRKLNEKLGFGEVHTPNINKAELFKISGHYDQYKEDMLSVSSQYVKDEMFLKPMNCPQHTQIYDSQPRSYKDLPIRYSDFANLYRDERPGELSGLTRLRAFAQDDGHVFCREIQMEDEISNILETIQEALARYQIGYSMRLSLHDPENKEKYLGGDDVWQKSESILKKLLEEKNIDYVSEEGEAAFYGPKIDIVAIDALGREWQISTIQLDFSMPERFDLTCINEKGEKERIVMIHRALIGSPDRFAGILIEHYGGAMPFWLSPVQVAVVPVAEVHNEYAQKIVDTLKENDFRVEFDDSNESMGKKIRSAKKNLLPYWIVIGDKDIEAGKLTLESREGEQSQITVTELIEKFNKENN